MVKDPNRPKGRTSAYAFFVLSCRDELRKRSPTSPVNFSTFSKDCSEQWTAMSPLEKKKFEDMATADHARYEEEMKHYVPPKDVGKKGKKKDPSAATQPLFSVFASELRPTVKNMVKDPNRPKGRTSAYAFFVLSCRDELRKRSPTSPVNFSTFSKDCSEQWTAMSPSEKKKFEDMATADQARYEEEMKHYVPPKDVGKKEPSAPKKPTSAFFIFCSELRPTLRSEYPNFSLSEIAKKLVEMWSKLDTEGRAPFEQKAVLLRGKYEKDVAACRAGGGAPKRGPVGPAGSTKKAQAGPEGDEEEDEDKEDDYDDDDMEDEEDDDEEEDDDDDDMGDEDEEEAEEDEDSDDLVDEEEEEDKERACV